MQFPSKNQSPVPNNHSQIQQLTQLEKSFQDIKEAKSNLQVATTFEEIAAAIKAAQHFMNTFTQQTNKLVQSYQLPG